MIMFIAQAILKRVLGQAMLKTRVIEGLRKEAAKSETKIDDQAVDIFAEAWEVIVPILVGKL